jgi:hypothetical protein
MRRFLYILALVCFVWSLAWGRPEQGASPAPPASSKLTPSAPQPSAPSPSTPPPDADALKAKAIIDQAIQALGGQAYLDVRDREQEGRGYSFHHGQATSGGVVFWSFSEFPDKERVEVTKERDVAELFIGNKGYELTYKGARPMEQKDLDDYLRRRRFSLETVLRTWVNDPGVIMLYEGTAFAVQRPALKVTLINAKDESVSLYFDPDTHLPIKKSFEWRDPVDRQKNLEEEIYENYRQVSGGILAPYNVTRYFNGDMSGQRFMSNVTINQGLDQAMFDPNSGYNPNKPKGKH